MSNQLRNNTRACRTCAGKKRRKPYDCHAPEYIIWVAMKKRCNRRANEDWDRYGGKGITVCERWNGPDSYPNFLEDMGPRPSPEHTIDRIDPKGPYSPENCRWLHRAEQSANRSNCIHVTYNGQTKILKQWAEELNLNYGTLHTRYQAGDRGARLFRKPKPKSLMITHNGRTQHIKSWAREFNLNHGTLQKRYNHGDRGDYLFRPVS
jgi:hypothetical protein